MVNNPVEPDPGREPGAAGDQLPQLYAKARQSSTVADWKRFKQAVLLSSVRHSFGLRDGDKVRVASRRGEITVQVQISPKAVDGTIFIPFHYARAAANRLTNAVLDPISGIPEFKVCAVRLDPAA